MPANPIGPLLARLEGVKPSSGGYMALCPAHEDRNPSLRIDVADDGKVLMKCHAGCEFDAICRALNMTAAELFEKDLEPRQRGEWTPAGEAVAVYDYIDENRHLLYQVLRTANKDFRQRVPDGSGWKWRLNGTRRVPYRLPQIIAAVDEGKRVWCVEGERDVHSLERIGEVATCNSGGAGKWLPEFSEFLREAQVTIVADADEPGRKHARQVQNSLVDVAASVRTVEAASGKDITDHLAAGLGLDDLVVTDTGTHLVSEAVDLRDFLAEPDVWSWVVDGLLERGDRLMVTGGEGMGKTVLIRQMAVCLAAGLHPFTQEPIPAVKVLVVDCENGVRMGRRKLRPIAIAAKVAGHDVAYGMMNIIHRRGLDLRREEEMLWLHDQVRAVKPEVLFIGPWYKLGADDPSDETAAGRIAAALDTVRDISDCAVVIETHSGHATGYGPRQVRPIGSSLVLRWPEFGYGLREAEDKSGVYDFVAWRGPRDEREWPLRLRRSGTGFPWEVVGNIGTNIVRDIEASQRAVREAQERNWAQNPGEMPQDPWKDNPGPMA